jgi:hypothetical protein
VDGVVKCGDVGERLMREVMGLEVVPDDLDVVEFGCVFRQPLDGEAANASRWSSLATTGDLPPMPHPCKSVLTANRNTGPLVKPPESA